MSSKRLVKYVTLVCLAVLFFIQGCRQAEENTKADKKIRLRWCGYAAVGYDQFRSEESKKFEKLYPDLTVTYEPVPGASYTSKVLTMIAGGTCPDVFYIPGASPFDLTKRGVLLDLTSYIEADKDFFAELNPKLMEGMYYKGKIYSLPGNANVYVMYYNKTIFDREGLAYPTDKWSWQDMIAAATKLTKRDSRGKVIQFGCNHPPGIELIRSFGGRLWNEDKTRCIIKSPQSVEALMLYKDLSDKYGVAPTQANYTEQGPADAFLTGRLAIYFGGGWDRSTFKLKGTTVDWGVSMLPKGKERAISLYYNCIGVPKSAKYPKLSYELIKFMIRPEGIKFLMDVGDSLPMRTKGEEVDYFLKECVRSEEEGRMLLDSLDNSYLYYVDLSHPNVPQGRMDQILSEPFEKFMLGLISAEETLQNIENDLNKLIITK